ncbi:MAG: tetratricopeptide repeat protein, partial [Candidatus Heimdallarchaeaceae archaeon]
LSLDHFARLEYKKEIFEEGITVLDEAFKESEEQKNYNSMFDALFVQFLIFKRLHMHEKAIQSYAAIQSIYNKFEEDMNDLFHEKQAMFHFLKYLYFHHKDVSQEDFSASNLDFINLLEKALEDCESSTYKFTLIPDEELILIILSPLSLCLIDNNELDKAKKYGEKGLRIAEKSKNDFWICRFYGNLSGVFWRKGRFDKHHNYLLKIKEKFEKLGYFRAVGNVNGNIGLFYSETGEHKRALEHYLSAYNVLSENGKREGYEWLLNNVGAAHSILGNYDEAIKYLEIALKSNELKKRIYAVNLNRFNIARIYRTKGNLDKSLQLLEEVLQYFIEKDLKLEQSGVLAEISQTYDRKGLQKKALETREKALEVSYQTEQRSFTAFLLYLLVQMTLNHNKEELAKKYFTELEKVTESIEFKNVKRLTLLAEAAILRNSSEIRDRIRAEALFDQLILEDLAHYLHIEILFQFCELLLYELKNTSDKKYLTKLLKNLDKMIEIGTTKHIPHLNIESLWFKSQLALLNLDFDKAKELLNQAFSIAEDKGLNQLALKISRSREDLIKQRIELEELEKESPTISKRMDTIKIENGFKEITKSEMFQFKQNI